MSLQKKVLALVAPVALLALSACTTGLRTEVQRFQAMPAPQGQSFIIQAADSNLNGSLEFNQYAHLVRHHLTSLGYTEASKPEDASMVVSLGYGVDEGRQEIVSYPDPWGYGYGYGPYGFGGYGRFGYYGRYGAPFYYGWHDPFFYGGGYGGYDVRTYTVFTSFLDMDIRRAEDGQALFEGLAQAHSRNDNLPVLVPNLIEAMFTGFPGNSGETVRITVAPERER